MTFEYEQKPWLMNQKTILTHNIIIFQRLNLFSKYQVTEISELANLSCCDRISLAISEPKLFLVNKFSDEKANLESPIVIMDLRNNRLPIRRILKAI